MQNTNDAGTGSLRQAIIDAAQGDTIRFNPNLIATSNDTIKLASELAFNKGLVFKGLYNSTDTLFISGQNAVRIFNIDLTSASNKVLIIDSLILVNGSANGDGGAIFLQNGDSLAVNNSMIAHNKSNQSMNPETRGGGIFATSPKITVNNSIIIYNTADIGAGIYTDFYNFGSTVNASLTINNSTVSHNSYTNNGSESNGGGIYTYAGSYSGIVNLILTINSSTIDHNNANNGGGVYANSYSYNANSNCTVIINESTFTNNTSNQNGFQGGNGGGVYTYAASYSGSSFLSTTANNSTFTNNSAVNGGGIYPNSYSYSGSNSSTTNLKGSIFAFNGANNIYNNTINSLGYNIFSDATITGSIASDILGVTLTQLNLDTLKNNGGTTKTLKPLCGSIAIDAGDASDLSDAQNGSLMNTRDIGAAENILIRDTIPTIIGCDNYTWSSNGNTYTNSGTYNDTVSCDTIKTLNLIINPSYSDTLLVPITICSNDSAQLFGTWRNTAGFYVDSNTTVNGCDSITTQELIVLPVVTNSISQNVCNGDSVQIGGNWYSTPQTVYDTVFNGATNGCDSIVTHVLQSCVGIDDLNNLAIYFNIYPNPAQQNITVNINNNQEINSTLEIFNVTGKLMHTQNVNTTKNTVINIENYTKGIYFIKLTANNKTATKKLVVN